MRVNVVDGGRRGQENGWVLLVGFEEERVKTLVLDKSVARGVAPEFLEGLRGRFDFLLMGHLLQEIMTEGMEERANLSASELRRLNGWIGATLSKVVCETSSEWIDGAEAIRWEVTKGSSARNAPRRCLGEVRNIEDYLTPELLAASLDQDERYRRLLFSMPGPFDSRVYAELEGVGEEVFFTDCLRRDLLSEEAMARVAAETKRGHSEKTEQGGGEVSSAFCPDKSWYAFGILLAHKAFLLWKWWKYGEQAPGVKEAANRIYDLYYLGFMAISDGLLSCDDHMLKMAWALWPEKRDSIYRYDMASRDIVRFVPKWES